MKTYLLLIGAFMSTNLIAYDKVFYCTYQNDECVESNNPIQVNKSDMNELVQQVGKIKKNFIGFVDKDGTTLQFYVDITDKIWLEIPVPEEKGSYGIYINQSVMETIIKNLNEPYLNLKDKLKLNFQTW